MITKQTRSQAVQILVCAASGPPGRTLHEVALDLDIEKAAPLDLARRALAESVGAGTWREARAEAASRLRGPVKLIKAKPLREPSAPPSALRHGHTSGGKTSATYRAWVNLRRTGPPVCERWHSFDAFLADVGAKPVGTRLKRADRKRGYEPGNVAWVDGDGRSAS